MRRTSNADAQFDHAVERWFRKTLEMDPIRATDLGVHDHDQRLPDGTRESIDEQISFHGATIAEMERFSADELSPDRALDRDLAIHEARLAKFLLSERRAWSGASGAAEQIGNALFPIFSRDYAMLPERLESIAARLEAAPDFIAQTRTRVDAPVAIWVEVDIETSESLPEFIQSVLASAHEELKGAAATRRLKAAADRTVDALQDHVEWLRNNVLPRATNTWQAGAEGFEELVKLRALEANSDEILAVGEQMLAAETSARDAVCREIDSTLSPARIGETIKLNYPDSFPHALDAYRKSMDEARAFVLEHGLATPPDRDRLLVVETPSFLRHVIPLAAYNWPAPFEADPVGIYMVTPPGSPELWREHNYASISSTSVHEAYPGHHLQHAAAATNSSRVRALSMSAAEFDEGWAFYCERMMKDAGFENTPANRFILHTEAIWRAARIILDIRLHRGEIQIDEAVDFLVERTGFERAVAWSEVRRYTSTPTYPLSYLYGRHMLESLRDRVAMQLGRAFNLKEFHDTLLYGGMMPVSFAARLFDLKTIGLE